MGNPFEHTSASWVRYSQYEWKKGKDGNLYLIPTETADPKPYDPLKDAEALVLDAMDIALLCFHKRPDTEIQSAILRFARNYGLLGIMTALPTTAKFVDYEKVYLLKNQFIKEEAMDTKWNMCRSSFRLPSWISVNGGLNRSGISATGK